MKNIPFNIPNYDEKFLDNISNHFVSNVSFIKKCQDLVKEKYNFNNTIFTTSCTHSLEMMAMILNIGTGDEVIIPSYTFVSTANAFVKFGASVKCIDSIQNDPMMDIDNIEKQISSKTKAIVVVHYGGNSCNMIKIKDICEKYNIYLLEDAAQAINSYYNGIPLGSFGILSAFSFHSTKNINCGEGGMLVINDETLVNKARIICDKGTNRYDFLNNIISKYQWIDKGSSYPMSELNAAYLYQQLVEIDNITNKRKELWRIYYKRLTMIVNKGAHICKDLSLMSNCHIFYIVFDKKDDIDELQRFLNKNDIQTFKHYSSLHTSVYYKANFENVCLPHSEKISENLLRLPLHNDLTIQECEYICKVIVNYYKHYIKIVKFKQLNTKKMDEIIELKSQFWNYSYDSQKKWLHSNIYADDINVMMYNSESKLIGYCLVLCRNCYILDSVIIDENIRGLGFGRIMMNSVMGNVIMDNGFLLCEKKNVDFYKRFGWLKNDIIEVKDKLIDNSLQKMTYHNKTNIVAYK